MKKKKFKLNKSKRHVKKAKSFHDLNVPLPLPDSSSISETKNDVQLKDSSEDYPKHRLRDDLREKYGFPQDKKSSASWNIENIAPPAGYVPKEEKIVEKEKLPKKEEKEESKFKGKTREEIEANQYEQGGQQIVLSDSEIRQNEITRVLAAANKGKILETYPVNANEVKVKVNIFDTPEGKIYFLKFPELSAPTKALLDNIKEKLVSSIDIKLEVTDVNAIEKLKNNLKARAEAILKQQFKLPTENINLLSGVLINEMIGLGNIELLVADPNLEEIVVTSAKEPIRVYHKRYGWLVTNLIVESENKIENYSSVIARRVGRQITTLTPMLDAHLVSGDRVNSILYPICTKGNTITIRKFAREPWTAVDFINNKTCSLDVFALIWTALQYELNVLFSGGTASGKTTILNVSSLFLPPYHRIISIEDTRELQLPEHLYWAPLITRLANPEGKGAITMLDLLVNSLRMRPDRIILGEMRRQEEAEVLFEAMHTGHSVYATVHADSAAETISRLVNPPINVPPNLLKAVHLNIVMFRDRRRGIRRTYQVAEFIPDESEKNGVKPNILYRYEPANDSIIKHSNSIRVFEELSRHTGLSVNEINKELENKKKILMDLVKRNVRDMNGIAQEVKKYYLQQQAQVESEKKSKKQE